MSKKCIKVAASKKAKAHIRCYNAKDSSKPKKEDVKGGGSGGSTPSQLKSKTGNINANYENTRIQKGEVFGKISDDDAKKYMGMAGIPGDVQGTAYVSKNKYGEILVKFENEDLFMNRSIDKSTMNNIEFKLKDSGKEKYNGTLIFERQVELSRANGIKEIKTYAAKGDDYNGYYTWARTGYKPKNEKDKNITDVVKKYNEQKGTNHKGLTDLMRDQDGRDFWKSNGVPFEAIFDLSEKSYSYKTLKEYAATKKGSN